MYIVTNVTTIINVYLLNHENLFDDYFNWPGFSIYRDYSAFEEESWQIQHFVGFCIVFYDALYCISFWISLDPMVVERNGDFGSIVPAPGYCFQERKFELYFSLISNGNCCRSVYIIPGSLSVVVVYHSYESLRIFSTFAACL